MHWFLQESACQVVKSTGDDLILQRIVRGGLPFLKKSKGSKKQGRPPKSNYKEDLADSELNVNGDFPQNLMASSCSLIGTVAFSDSNKTKLFMFILSMALLDSEHKSDGNEQLLLVINAYTKPKCHLADSDAVHG